MAKIFSVNADVANEPFQYLDDIVGVIEDSTPVSDAMAAAFNFVTVGGTKDEVEAKLEEINFTYAEAHYNPVTESYQFTDPYHPDSTSKQVWTPGGAQVRWYTVATPFKFPHNMGTLTAEEKQLLGTVNINHPSVDSVIRKIRKDLVAANPENDIEVVELRNEIP